MCEEREYNQAAFFGHHFLLGLLLALDWDDCQQPWWTSSWPRAAKVTTGNCRWSFLFSAENSDKVEVRRSSRSHGWPSYRRWQCITELVSVTEILAHDVFSDPLHVHFGSFFPELPGSRTTECSGFFYEFFCFLFLNFKPIYTIHTCTTQECTSVLSRKTN